MITKFETNPDLGFDITVVIPVNISPNRVRVINDSSCSSNDIYVLAPGHNTLMVRHEIMKKEYWMRKYTNVIKGLEYWRRKYHSGLVMQNDLEIKTIASLRNLHKHLEEARARIESLSETFRFRDRGWSSDRNQMLKIATAINAMPKDAPEQEY